MCFLELSKHKHFEGKEMNDMDKNFISRLSTCFIFIPQRTIYVFDY
jgi:hypothetical protein